MTSLRLAEKPLTGWTALTGQTVSAVECVLRRKGLSQHPSVGRHRLSAQQRDDPVVGLLLAGDGGAGGGGVAAANLPSS